MKLHHRLFATLMIFMLPIAAHAIPIQFTYDSGPLPGAPPGATNVTGEFTVNYTQLNLFPSTTTQPISAFAFTAGNLSISSTNATVLASQFRNDQQGRITHTWIRLFQQAPVSGQDYVRILDIRTNDGVNVSAPFQGGTGLTIARWNPLLQTYQHRSQFSQDHGLLALAPPAPASTPMPEPGSLGLLAAGLLGVAFRRKIGRRRA